MRSAAWTTSFAEEEDDVVRASAWMSNNVCLVFDHVASYLDVSDLRCSLSVKALSLSLSPYSCRLFSPFLLGG